jgi:Domain of unknown function (DUF4865)
MFAMQYEVNLPADYDMGIVRHRVETRGSTLDAFPGLGLMAYMIREGGKAGSQIDQYGPCGAAVRSWPMHYSELSARVVVLRSKGARQGWAGLPSAAARAEGSRPEGHP